MRSGEDARRARACADLDAAARAICTRRGLELRCELVQETAAVACAPELAGLLARAVEASGHPVRRMPSGAGHDAMKLHEVMPQAMLFVRGENAGISHNPLESITSDDAELCVRAFSHLLGQLESELG